MSVPKKIGINKGHLPNTTKLTPRLSSQMFGPNMFLPKAYGSSIIVAVRCHSGVENGKMLDNVLNVANYIYLSIGI